MQITILNVSAPEQKISKAGKPYTAIAVMYTNEQGQRSTQNILDRNLMSTFGGFVQNDLVNVVTDGAQPYPKWLAANKLGNGAPAIGVQSQAATPVAAKTTSTYETSEERAKKQVYIIRQSSISAAINLLGTGAKTPAAISLVLDTAKAFEDYVFGVEALGKIPELDDFPDDIPY